VKREGKKQRFFISQVQGECTWKWGWHKVLNATADDMLGCTLHERWQILRNFAAFHHTLRMKCSCFYSWSLYFQSHKTLFSTPEQSVIVISEVILTLVNAVMQW
jgi:hypothetical protein